MPEDSSTFCAGPLPFATCSGSNSLYLHGPKVFAGGKNSTCLFLVS